MRVSVSLLVANGAADHEGYLLVRTRGLSIAHTQKKDEYFGTRQRENCPSTGFQTTGANNQQIQNTGVVIVHSLQLVHVQRKIFSAWQILLQGG